MKVVTIVSVSCLTLGEARLGLLKHSAGLWIDTVTSAYVKRSFNVVPVALGTISSCDENDNANVFRVLNAAYGSDEI